MSKANVVFDPYNWFPLWAFIRRTTCVAIRQSTRNPSKKVWLQIGEAERLCVIYEISLYLPRYFSDHSLRGYLPREKREGRT